MSVRDDQLATLNVAGKDYDYYRIADLPGVDHLPYSLKVLVENLVRNIDGANITDEHVKTLLNWAPQAQPSHEIQFTPSRVIIGSGPLEIHPAGHSRIVSLRPHR